MVFKKRYKMKKEHKRKIGLANAIIMKQYWKDGKATQNQIMRGYYNKNKKEELGYVNSPETRKKLSKIMKDKIKSGEFNPRDISPFVKGHKTGMTGKKQSEYQKMIVGEKLKETRKYQIFPKKDTKIEVKIQDFLKELKIEYFTHQYMNINHGYQCDIFIPSKNLVIECDGNYWHSYPTGKEIDYIRTKELIEKGFKVLRLWEIDIKKMTLNNFKQQIGETD